MINEFGIRGGLVLAKKLEVDPYNFTDENLGITLYDLIEFHTLFKMLPMIEMLVLDEDATKRMVNTYGDDAQGIWQMFQEERTLKLIRINNGTGWKDYRRDSFSAQANALNEDLAITRHINEIQHTCDIKNPHKENMSKGYIYGVKQNAKEMRQHSFGVAKEAFMAKNPKLFKTVLYSGLGLGLMGVGAIASVTGGLKQLLRRR